MSLFKYIDHEIDETENLLEHITGGWVLSDGDVNDDIKTMNFKIGVLKDAKSMIEKASMEIEGEAKWALMTTAERKILLRLVKFLLFFRRKRK